MIHLSKQELQILNLIAFEHNANEIAKKLCISERSARSHRKILLKKLNVRNVAGLMRRSFELGLLDVSNLKEVIPSALSRPSTNKNFRYHPEMGGNRVLRSSLEITN